MVCDVVCSVVLFPHCCVFCCGQNDCGRRDCHSGVVTLLFLSFIPPQADYYVLDEAFMPSLLSKKQEIQSARQKASSVLGWDVPFSSLKFSVALGSCKYGEVFRGMMDEQEVAVKTLKPDGGEIARESFDRELNLL